jgi:hypothetical protein
MEELAAVTGIVSSYFSEKNYKKEKNVLFCLPRAHRSSTYYCHVGTL